MRRFLSVSILRVILNLRWRSLTSRFRVFDWLTRNAFLHVRGPVMTQ